MLSALHGVSFLAFISVYTKFGLEGGSLRVCLVEMAENILTGLQNEYLATKQDESELEHEIHAEAKGRRQPLEREGRIWPIT